MSDDEATEAEVSADVLTVIQATGDLLGKAASRPDGPEWCAAFLAGQAQITITRDRLHVEPIGDGDGPELSIGQYL